MKKVIAIMILAILVGLFAMAAMAAPLGNPIVAVQNSTAAGDLIAKASSGLLNGFSATSGASNGYVLIFDSATVPSDGPVTPKLCYILPAYSTTGASWINNPVNFVNGITLVFSTTGCFSKTISNTGFFSAQVQ